MIGRAMFVASRDIIHQLVQVKSGPEREREEEESA